MSDNQKFILSKVINALIVFATAVASAFFGN